MNISSDYLIEGDSLVGYTGTESKIVIPEGVKWISFEAFQDNMNIVSVEFSEGVERIAEGAFNRCRNLTEIKLPDSLIEISMGAFARCSSLERITIPKNVKKIGCSAFLDCTNLSIVDYNAIRCKNITSDGNYDFYTYYDVGNFYDDIEPVFSGCVSLKTVNIGPEVKYIPSELFRLGPVLEKVNILGTKKLKIGFKAFNENTDFNDVFNCEGDTEIIFEPLKNYNFPAVYVERGANVSHKVFGSGVVEDLNPFKNIIKVKFYDEFYRSYSIKYFEYPNVFYLDDLKIVR